ncbi:MAG: class I SAM-dependent methyltransferase, partial [Clostridia bacterium]|nr:class I SAM-dependent methyltransferase [Clostridia bacterium]
CPRPTSPATPASTGTTRAAAGATEQPNNAKKGRAAFAARPRRIIVKRPPKGPYLAGRRPDHSLTGKAVRFDVFTLF